MENKEVIKKLEEKDFSCFTKDEEGKFEYELLVYYEDSPSATWDCGDLGSATKEEIVSMVSEWGEEGADLKIAPIDLVFSIIGTWGDGSKVKVISLS